VPRPYRAFDPAQGLQQEMVARPDPETWQEAGGFVAGQAVHPQPPPRQMLRITGDDFRSTERPVA